MKKYHRMTVSKVVLIAILALGILMFARQVAGAQVAQDQVAIKAVPEIALVKKDILTKRQRAWLGALEWCESHHNDAAINKVDRDGTPSYGRLQFKPSTFSYLMKRYDIGTSTDYMNGDLQELIVEQMIIRGDVKWYQQFPDCTKRLGNPPASAKISTSTASTSVDKK